MIVRPSQVTWILAHGSGSMGAVETVSSVGRFQHPTARSAYTLYGIRGNFSGGSASASLAIRIDSRHEAQDLVAYTAPGASSQIASRFDFTLFTLPKIGTGGVNLHLRILPEEYPFFTFYRDTISGRWDTLVLEWTNPNTQVWALEVGLFDSSNL